MCLDTKASERMSSISAKSYVMMSRNSPPSIGPLRTKAFQSLSITCAPKSTAFHFHGKISTSLALFIHTRTMAVTSNFMQAQITGISGIASL